MSARGFTKALRYQWDLQCYDTCGAPSFIWYSDSRNLHTLAKNAGFDVCVRRQVRVGQPDRQIIYILGEL